MDLYEPFALAAALVALLSLLYLAWDVDPVWALCGAIATSVFSGNWELLGVPLGPDRLLFAVGVLALLLRAPGARDRPPIRIELVHWLLALTALYAIGSAAWVGTLGEKTAVFKLLDPLGIVPFLMFLIAPLAFRTARQRAALLYTLILVGIYLALTAVFEVLEIEALVFPKYILDPTIGIHEGRARGPFVEAVGMGLALYACGVAAIVAGAGLPRRRWLTVGAVGVAVLCAVGVLLTLTRAVWLGAMLATAVTMLAAPELRRFVVPTTAGGIVLVLAALAFVPGLGERADERRGDQWPVWDRLNTNAAAIDMIAARPLLGFGWNRFEAESPIFFRQSAEYPLTGERAGVHNVFLARGVELGLLGTLLITAGLVLGVGRAMLSRGPPELRPWRFGLVALAISWLVAANLGPLPYAFPNLLLWAWAGVVLGGSHQESAEPSAAVTQLPALPAQLPATAARS